MIIKGKKTIEEYKKEKIKRIEKWIDDNFQKGAVSWTFKGSNAIELTDRTNAKKVIKLSDID